MQFNQTNGALNAIQGLAIADLIALKPILEQLEKNLEMGKDRYLAELQYRKEEWAIQHIGNRANDYEDEIISDCLTMTSACLIDAISTKRPL